MIDWDYERSRCAFPSKDPAPVVAEVRQAVSHRDYRVEAVNADGGSEAAAEGGNQQGDARLGRSAEMPSVSPQDGALDRARHLSTDQGLSVVQGEPLVAEVRRASTDPLTDAAYESFIRGTDIPATAEAARRVLVDRCLAAEAEVARLTAERDDLLAEKKTYGEYQSAYLDVLAEVLQRKADLEALRTHLRGLEQQWRHDQIDWVDPRTKCAEELAALLITPEEPGT